jgi:hypothetical protein
MFDELNDVVEEDVEMSSAEEVGKYDGERRPPLGKVNAFIMYLVENTKSVCGTRVV